MKKIGITTRLLSLALLFVGVAISAQASSEDPLKAQLSLSPGQTAPGGTIEIKIKMKLEGDYHAYLERFKLKVNSPDDLKLDDYKISPIVQFDDIISKRKKAGVEKDATLKAVIEVPEGFKIGTTPLVLALTYQACTKDHCLFPKTVELKTFLKVVEARSDERLRN